MCSSDLSGEEGDVHVGEDARLGLLDPVLAARALEDLAGRTGGGKETQGGKREVPLVQEPKELLTDRAGDADDSDREGR